MRIVAVGQEGHAQEAAKVADGEAVELSLLLLRVGSASFC
jgi:hypothetical protein